MDSDEGPNTSSCGRAGAFHLQESQLRRSTERRCGLNFSFKAIPWSQATVSLGVAMWRWFHCSTSMPASNEVTPDIPALLCASTTHATLSRWSCPTCNLPALHAMPEASAKEASTSHPDVVSAKWKSRTRRAGGKREVLTSPDVKLRWRGRTQEIARGSHTSRPAIRPIRTAVITPAIHLARRKRGAAGM